uniref:Uncharacterized protein n=1 Tax=Kwoniella bestiolae CBS 10118 TaxID=1296100 RepID=A0A1B9FVU0_9TREE|nr:hypothetical protein I302_07239 [Kwoniella bestiolae CBS 10118]OCF22892.1 hypothetical protein I302_07239 [Kwoniella bestiolae CBS 10118]
MLNFPIYSLRLPAILQNPKNTTLKQVEAHNAQQRERIQARREARAEPKIEGRLNGKGKRVIRRLDNASFTSNPHIAPPSKSDYYPSVPLQPRLVDKPIFPSDAVPRKASIPSTIPPERGNNSADSVNGNFQLSLKGIRALLRKKRGRRVEGLVQGVEQEMRGWLGGDWDVTNLNGHSSDGEGRRWKIIDETLVDIPIEKNGEGSGSGSSTNGNGSGSNRRRLPAQHQITGSLPSLPEKQDGSQVSAILEISRSPAHLSWYVVDPFERLVVHLLARYYELVSWSESHQTISNESIRLTHIILPTIIKPRLSSTSNNLLTPETSELSSQSGPESTGSFTASESDTESESGSDTATERGDDSGPEIGYSLEEEGDTTLTSLPEGLSDLRLAQVGEVEVPLQRSISNSSSAYASSEGGNSDYSLLDSLTLPPRPPTELDGWSDFGSGSESGLGLGDLPKISVRNRDVQLRSAGGLGRKGWEDKPSFFEYLYGA